MESKYTPGPWKWHDLCSDARLIGRELVTEHRPIRCNDPVIFAIREDWIAPQSEEREAAYRLIAAAPDLVEALQGLLSWPALMNCVDTRVTKAREALAKAGVQ